VSPTTPSKQQQAEPFYAAIGRAVTNWQLVEDGVGKLFAHLMSPTNVSSKISAQAAFDVRYVPYINPPKPEPQQYGDTEILETGEAFLRLYREIVNFGIETGAILPPPETP
jgi:hypothetical protein